LGPVLRAADFPVERGVFRPAAFAFVAGFRDVGVAMRQLYPQFLPDSDPEEEIYELASWDMPGSKAHRKKVKRVRLPRQTR